MADDKRIAEMEETLKRDREKNLIWISNIAGVLVRMDQSIEEGKRRIEQNEKILEEMRAERRQRNGNERA